MKSTRKYIEINPLGETGLRWIENIGTAWRLIGFADEINQSIKHTGWYTDEYGDLETLRGIVYKLPSRKGEPVYAVGYDDPNNSDCALVAIRTDLEDDSEAAYAADRIAEQCAESEREYQNAWSLGNQYLNCGEMIEAERVTRKNLFAELRSVSGMFNADTPTICGVIRSRIADTRRNIKSAYKDRRTIIKDHYISRNLISAFADGAGLDLDTVKELF